MRYVTIDFPRAVWIRRDDTPGFWEIMTHCRDRIDAELYVEKMKKRKGALGILMFVNAEWLILPDTEKPFLPRWQCHQ